MACCEAPDPRILEKNNRLFCGNCKRYLDRQSQQDLVADEVPESPPPDVIEAGGEETT